MLFVIFRSQDSGVVQAAGGGEGMGVDYNRFFRGLWLGGGGTNQAGWLRQCHRSVNLQMFVSGMDFCKRKTRYKWGSRKLTGPHRKS